MKSRRLTLPAPRNPFAVPARQRAAGSHAARQGGRGAARRLREEATTVLAAVGDRRIVRFD